MAHSVHCSHLEFFKRTLISSHRFHRRSTISWLNNFSRWLVIKLFDRAHSGDAILWRFQSSRLFVCAVLALTIS